MRILVPLLALTALTAHLSAACGDNRTRAPDRAAYEAGAPAPLACVPNLDGKIEAREAASVTGVPVRFLVPPAGVERVVDIAGRASPEGQRIWDLGVDYVDDRVATVSASALAGKWYAASFPKGTFVTPFDLAGTIDAIYTETDEALLLLGLASTAKDPAEQRTLYVYQSPIPVLQFPLTPGRSWVATSAVRDATLRGLPYAGEDTYEVSVDAAGRLTLPDVTFAQAMRVRTRLTVVPAAGATSSTRQVSFLSECLGEVARATSKKDEAIEDFTVAAELRRLGL